MRQRRNALSDEEVKKILTEGAQKAKERASKKMQDVRFDQKSHIFNPKSEVEL
ncbi:MAG: hypothetical protein AAB968_04155 [Patescibacteria group bacterium]